LGLRRGQARVQGNGNGSEIRRFATKITKDTKVSDKHFSELRALRVLRGEGILCFFDCDLVTLGYWPSTV
ncbi:MAG TPA: hypothetical protein VF208_06150, partial [Candidatus Binatia bacterium]